MNNNLNKQSIELILKDILFISIEYQVAWVKLIKVARKWCVKYLDYHQKDLRQLVFVFKRFYGF